MLQQNIAKIKLVFADDTKVQLTTRKYAQLKKVIDQLLSSSNSSSKSNQEIKADG